MSPEAPKGQSETTISPSEVMSGNPRTFDGKEIPVVPAFLKRDNPGKPPPDIDVPDFLRRRNSGKLPTDTDVPTLLPDIDTPKPDKQDNFDNSTQNKTGELLPPVEPSPSTNTKSPDGQTNQDAKSKSDYRLEVLSALDRGRSNESRAEQVKKLKIQSLKRGTAAIISALTAGTMATGGASALVSFARFAGFTATGAEKGAEQAAKSAIAKEAQVWSVDAYKTMEDLKGVDISTLTSTGKEIFNQRLENALASVEALKTHGITLQKYDEYVKQRNEEIPTGKLGKLKNIVKSSMSTRQGRVALLGLAAGVGVTAAGGGALMLGAAGTAKVIFGGYAGINALIRGKESIKNWQQAKDLEDELVSDNNIEKDLASDILDKYQQINGSDLTNEQKKKLEESFRGKDTELREKLYSETGSMNEAAFKGALFGGGKGAIIGALMGGMANFAHASDSPQAGEGGVNIALAGNQETSGEGNVEAGTSDELPGNMPVGLEQADPASRPDELPGNPPDISGATSPERPDEIPGNPPDVSDVAPSERPDELPGQAPLEGSNNEAVDQPSLEAVSIENPDFSDDWELVGEQEFAYGSGTETFKVYEIDGQKFAMVTLVDRDHDGLLDDAHLDKHFVKVPLNSDGGLEGQIGRMIDLKGQEADMGNQNIYSFERKIDVVTSSPEWQKLTEDQQQEFLDKFKTEDWTSIVGRSGVMVDLGQSEAGEFDNIPDRQAFLNGEGKLVAIVSGEGNANEGPLLAYFNKPNEYSEFGKDNMGSTSSLKFEHLAANLDHFQVNPGQESRAAEWMMDNKGVFPDNIADLLKNLDDTTALSDLLESTNGEFTYAELQIGLEKALEDVSIENQTDNAIGQENAANEAVEAPQPNSEPTPADTTTESTEAEGAVPELEPGTYPVNPDIFVDFSLNEVPDEVKNMLSPGDKLDLNSKFEGYKASLEEIDGEVLHKIVKQDDGEVYLAVFDGQGNIVKNPETNELIKIDLNDNQEKALEKWIEKDPDLIHRP